MNGDKFKPTRQVSYEELRQEFQPGDAVFYGPLPFSAIDSLPAIGGYLSNQGIRAVQFLGADHRRLNNYIHGELLVPMVMGGSERWLLAGFTNKRNVAGGGLDINAASWRTTKYAGDVLYMPVRDELRAGLTDKRLVELIDKTFGIEYGWENLFSAESRLAVGGTTPHPYCTSWIARLYITSHVINCREFCFTNGKPGKRNLSDMNVSPKDLLQSFSYIWNDDRAAVVKPGV